MIGDLLLLSGNDIPFQEARLTLHQPTIKEIAYIGEENFFMGCQMLDFSKNILSVEDKSHLTNNSDFEVFMSIMKDTQTLNLQTNRLAALMVLSLIFPDYQCSIGANELEFTQEKETNSINANNFEQFKDIIEQMFCLQRNKDNGAMNPMGEQARKIAEKLEEGRRKVAESKGEIEKISLLSTYVSILAIGQLLNIDTVLNYTVYQLFDQFERYNLKEEFDANFRCRLAGAKDLDKPDDWMKDIHN